MFPGPESYCDLGLFLFSIYFVRMMVAMDTEQKQKKVLFAGLTILVLAGILLYSVSIFDRQVAQITDTTPPEVLVQGLKQQPIQGVSEPAKVSSIDWAKVQLDACGGEAKYRTLPWWETFMIHASQTDYYSKAYIQSELKSVSENKYANPAGTVYTDQAVYCAALSNVDAAICAKPVRKLTNEDFLESGEGCLSKNGEAFIAVFPGEYMGGGNHVLRYDIETDILEVAMRVNDPLDLDGYTWNAPPTSFGKRVGNMIKMFGGTGDAGCSGTTEFDYDYAANKVEMTKRCGMCDGEKPVCQLF